MSVASRILSGEEGMTRIVEVDLLVRFLTDVVLYFLSFIPRYMIGLVT